MITMQDALLALNTYWTGQGCLIGQPMNTEVGAGTLNPATFLRVQGPEPWRVAYVEPSVRPDDSRYGENPNRLQTHTQYQVILKPEPGHAQELYLGSLRALGIDTAAHDIRFVEDNWASPALGAWGLGWEVWLDGLEITQFTYFQQAGGIALDPVSVEITYGVERILMALQGVSHFKDIAYAPGISYGEAFGQAEYEMSRYYLDDADLDTNRTLFEAYAGEARQLLDARLPVPAYTYVLKCSHTFNVLDARGAVSTTERARAFARMRALAHEVARLWAERRAELGHPLGLAPAPVPALAGPTAAGTGAAATLLFEIGVEELPPAEVTRTAEAVRVALGERLRATRLGHGAVRVHASPRRVVAVVEQVQPREEDHEQTVRGPRVSAAFDAEGRPTKAVLGFARSQGVEVAELDRVEEAGTAYVATTRRLAGRPAGEVLTGLLAELVGSLRAEKNMRWNAPGLAFSRPIRWLLALLGEQLLPVAVATLAAGRSTRVHRTAVRPTVEVPSAEGYLEFLAGHGILADVGQRRRLVVDGATSLAAEVGAVIDLAAQDALIDEITNLVEQPTPILGRFDPTYLELPEEILVTVMRKHQRYLPVQDAEGRLLPYFVAVANGDCDHDVVRAGNEAVLRARYEDAAFFWRADLQTAPAAMKEKLALLTFEERLGSMADRAERIAVIAGRLADSAGLAAEERRTLDRAAALVKFDLGSQLVVELSSLAGVMAGEYAGRAGEDPAVARALFETELPRFAEDRLPTGRPGALLALADRFDLLAGLFAIGAAPTGGSDPFGLRRSALGVVNILRAFPELAAVTVEHGLAVAAEQQRVVLEPAVLRDASQFVLRRFEQQLLEAGHAVDDVRAVLALGGAPVRAERALAELEALSGDERFAALVAAVQRVRRIVPAGTEPATDPALFDSPAERALYEAVRQSAARLDADAGPARFTAATGPLVRAVNEFFEEVLVMAEDPGTRANRLGLLASVGALAAPVLGWQELR
ncbi:glycyl-tRNA synthetase [Kitasatospora sp. MAP12-15]|uniref:glycine--tRNA ligase n=1 Tax=unclassified Kitasatospora TaxID=2633591 RepID=UPI0024761B8A|nr:glycine--tRNA ligase [Kitasatospora sp. MAP12-44]MDH6111775.1 glycyl-tRNA synthetase [Kitasatospora sp. MAP12-44]